MGQPVEDDVLVLIRRHIRSIWALELLLVMQRERWRVWTETELVAELRASAAVVRDNPAALSAIGAVVVQSSNIHYHPREASVAGVIDRLIYAYQQRPTAVMKAIAAKPDHRIQTFADAFRFKLQPP